MAFIYIRFTDHGESFTVPESRPGGSRSNEDLSCYNTDSNLNGFQRFDVPEAA
ncbi:hypothetical protein D7B24_000459, partial [Verticillium nonalfalfae]